MEVRSMLKNIFKTDKQPRQTKELQIFKLLNSYSPNFVPASIETNDLVKACINCIATHASKFEIQHKKQKDENGVIKKINGEINYLLSVKPNPIMTPSQFIYKIVFNLYMQNNSFIYIDRDADGMIIGYYPITASSYELYEDKSGAIYIKFNFASGQNYILPYAELIHIRRLYDGEVFGSNNDSLRKAIETDSVAMQGIDNAIKSTACLRGLLKYNNGMLDAEKMKKYKNEFVNDYMNIENSSGVAMIDGKLDYTPLNVNPITLTDTQLNVIKTRIFNYFGLNEAIVSGNFTSEQWNAFFESVLEPLAIQLEESFTAETFTASAIKSGNKIVFNVDRIRYAKTETKISLIKELGVLGLLTVDEARRIMDLKPLGGEDGAKRLQTLNVVNSELADTYQLGEEQ